MTVNTFGVLLYHNKRPVNVTLHFAELQSVVLSNTKTLFLEVIIYKNIVKLILISFKCYSEYKGKWKI